MRVGSACFAEHAVPDLEQRDGHWLGQQGRLTTPVVKRPGDTHYRPVSWNEAIRVVADGLKALDSPDAAAFYPSGRTSNEAAFLYQLLARRFRERTSVVLGKRVSVRVYPGGRRFI